VSTELSCLGTFMQSCDADGIAEIIQETVAIFGAERCMSGSNFPIEKLWTSYGALLDAHRAAAAQLSDLQQRAIFHDTAARVFRL